MIPAQDSSAKKMKIFLSIPARYASTRLPGKMIAQIGTKTLIEHVVQRTLLMAPKIAESLNAETVIVIATDHVQITNVLKPYEVEVVMTDEHLPSGTDRIYAALKEYNPNSNDLIINIQGDEPFFSQNDILSLAHRMKKDAHLPLGTLAYKRTSTEFFLKPSVVKVAIDKNQCALYFSRAPIPWPRKQWGASAWPQEETLQQHEISFLHHIGVYAYRWFALEAMATQFSPSEMELCEGLEQLRALENGLKIGVEAATESPSGIDTPEDLERARQHLE